MSNNDTHIVDVKGRIGIIQSVKNPLGFFVLVVLIVEAIFGLIVMRLTLVLIELLLFEI